MCNYYFHLLISAPCCYNLMLIILSHYLLVFTPCMIRQWQGQCFPKENYTLTDTEFLATLHIIKHSQIEGKQTMSIIHIADMHASSDPPCRSFAATSKLPSLSYGENGGSVGVPTTIWNATRSPKILQHHQYMHQQQCIWAKDSKSGKIQSGWIFVGRIRKATASCPCNFQEKVSESSRESRRKAF